MILLESKNMYSGRTVEKNWRKGKEKILILKNVNNIKSVHKLTTNSDTKRVQSVQGIKQFFLHFFI